MLITSDLLNTMSLCNYYIFNHFLIESFQKSIELNL